MSRDDNFEEFLKRLDGKNRRTLLAELESIRTLLNEDSSGDSPIPILSEVVQSTRPVAQPEDTQHDLFDPRVFADRLLDADWTEKRERILSDAKANVAAFRLSLDKQTRLEREQRLQEAAQERLGPRMEQLLGEAVDELRENLARVLRRELEAMLTDVFSPVPQNPEQSSREG